MAEWSARLRDPLMASPQKAMTGLTIYGRIVDLAQGVSTQEKTDEGAYRRWRIWRTGGGCASDPQRRGVRGGYHDLRSGRAAGRRVFSRRQRGKRLQPAGLRLRQGISLHVRTAKVDPLRTRSRHFRHGGFLRLQ